MLIKPIDNSRTVLFFRNGMEACFAFFKRRRKSASVYSTIRKLNDRVGELTTLYHIWKKEASEYDPLIGSYMMKNDRAAARRYYTRKKHLLNAAEKLADMADNLHGIILKMEQQLVVASIQSVMGEANNQMDAFSKRFSIDDVDSLLGNLEENMHNIDNVVNALSEGVKDDISPEEIEEELDAFLENHPGGNDNGPLPNEFNPARVRERIQAPPRPRVSKPIVEKKKKKKKKDPLSQPLLCD